jgi:hypothetical protein
MQSSLGNGCKTDNPSSPLFPREGKRRVEWPGTNKLGPEHGEIAIEISPAWAGAGAGAGKGGERGRREARMDE